MAIPTADGDIRGIGHERVTRSVQHVGYLAHVLAVLPDIPSHAVDEDTGGCSLGCRLIGQRGGDVEPTWLQSLRYIQPRVPAACADRDEAQPVLSRAAFRMQFELLKALAHDELHIVGHLIDSIPLEPRFHSEGGGGIGWIVLDLNVVVAIKAQVVAEHRSVHRRCRIAGTDATGVAAD